MASVTIQPLSPTRYSARRQFLFFSLVIVLTACATWVMADILWRGGLTAIEHAMLILFVPLFGMISLGFVQAAIGFGILWRRRDPGLISVTLPDGPATPDDLPATAIALPIFNEDVSRVYEGLRTIYLSLARTGCLARFDFFILSDSNDPNKWVEEQVAWVDLCKQLKGFGRIFYRRRNVPLNKKSGNVSDFLRRWGRKYRYMVVLDADSLMDGRTLVRLVRLMEANPQAGLIQTAPAPIQGRTLYARMLQFAQTLYGPIFQAGLNYWQAGNGNFWGHNAIIRVAPFMEHCALPPLSGSFRVSRVRFLSHDYVEAALMRKANYQVWLAYDLEGSYENPPPTLIDAAVRDRRWCRGNLQHAWLLGAGGLHPINRLHLFLGIMSYLTSPLWLAFLVLGTVQSWRDATAPFRRYDYDVGLTSFLDVGGGRLALWMFVGTMTMLTLPKVLSWLLALRDWRRRIAFGGTLPLTVGVLLEHLLSALLAPVHMMFNSASVLAVLAGRTIGWGPQRRDGGGVDWRGIVLTHTPHLLIGVGWAWLARSLNPVFFWWISPVTFGLILSIPLALLLSGAAAGASAERARLFITPQERTPPTIVTHLEKSLSAVQRRLPAPEWLRPHAGVMQAVLDPYINAVHVSLLRQKRKLNHKVTDYLARLQDRLLEKGPSGLSRREQLALLINASSMLELHERVWRTPEAKLSPWWKLAMRHYNTLTSKPATPLYR